jgi:2-dehydro-3-deoxygluconokinase
MIERIGGGDAFSAALIYGLLHEWQLPKIGEFAVAAYALKHSIAGDFNVVTVDEVERFAAEGEGASIQR